MRVALGSFENELENLGGFLDASEAEDKLLAAMFSRMEAVSGYERETLEVVNKYSTIKRRQSYVSSIIVLYGALERYVEEAVEEYTESLVQICQHFGDLPKNLRERHTSLTIDYLALLKEGRLRMTEDVGQIVAALNGCLNEVPDYRLNARAFSIRSGNMKFARVREILKNLDIEVSNRRVLSMPAYRGFLFGMHGLAVPDTGEGEVMATLDHVDELVDLRNDIAHGVADLSEIEEPQIVRERARKLGAFAAALNEILLCELVSARMALNQLVLVKGEVQVFNDNIVCFCWPSGRLAVGDVLVMKPGDPKADLRHGDIRSIEIDNVGCDEVEGSDGLMIGVKVQFKAKANGVFYVWPAGV